jgi:hypothetical protein
MRSSLAYLFSALICLFTAGSFTPVQAIPSLGNILIVAGTDGLAQTSANVLNTELTNAGFTVTSVNTGVPGSLAGYSQIYDVRFDNNPPFSAGEMAQYLAFLNAAPGNTIFLMGENAGFSVRNIPISAFIALAGGGTIAAPASSSQAVENLKFPFTGPTAISTVKFAACGVVTSAGTGDFASTEAGGASGCSIFFDRGQLANAPMGALVIVYDVNFIGTAPDNGAINEVPYRTNLEQFAASPPAAPPNTPIPSSALLVLVGGIAIVGFEITRARAKARRI